jgi:predicted amidophosphoribosyltransferase
MLITALLDALAKCEKQLLASLCLSVCSSAWKNSAPNERIFIKFDTRAFFQNVSTKFKFDQNLTRITDILLERLTYLLHGGDSFLRS